ncbi:uncharacterized protein [Fopius arisanus]|uniref:Reverse transcriptase domain-containing protein n=1 Tax=Fopius arisanus TaxID=64838 RepID=A0A9R1SZ25_9HYME|nr:PREDICTED: uncharacterized protein LOC105264518 [Fopius arisanus]
MEGGGGGIKRVAWKICSKVWKGEGWPVEWKDGLLAPIVKKGEGEGVEEYRGVTLMQTLYKIYATELTRAIEKEVEEKGMVPENQTGFRRGMGTMDNIFVLNYLVNRQMKEKGGKLVACFIDLKAAFDSVNRKRLWEAMKERSISEGLIERTKEMYRETGSKVRIGCKMSEKF